MGNDKNPNKVVCRNKRARHDYEISDTFEAGLVLTGTEVKSLRQHKADIKDSYATCTGGEIFLVGFHISPYEKASHFNHEPRRERKLLLHKRVIQRLTVRIKERGYTLVPLEVYFKGGWAKVLLGLGKGKKRYDHRNEIRARDEKKVLAED